MSERVLVLGAGASLGARKGLVQAPPPLGRELAGYLLRWLDANDPALPTVTTWPAFAATSDPFIVGPGPWQERRLLTRVRAELEKVAAQDGRSDAPHFEKLMDRWAAAWQNRDHLELTQRLLAYAMNFGHACGFHEQKDRFDDLLHLFNPSVIVTVNYDLLVEQALRRRSMRHSHPGIPAPAAPGSHRDIVSEGTGPVVPVFKLHGSVDWLPTRSGADGATFEIVEKQAAENPMTPRPNAPPGKKGETPLFSYDTKHTYQTPNGGTLRTDLEHGDVPVIAVYGRGKPLLRNLAHVQAHRQACVNLLSPGSVGCVLVVGIRPVTTRDDRTLYNLLRQLGATDGEKTYVSPVRVDCAEFRRRRFTPVQKTLADFLRDS